MRFGTWFSSFFFPLEQLLGCAVWLFGGELPLFSYNSDSSPLSLVLVIIIMTMMCTGFRAAFVPLQCQLLPRLARIITEFHIQRNSDNFKFQCVRVITEHPHSPKRQLQLEKTFNVTTLATIREDTSAFVKKNGLLGLTSRNQIQATASYWNLTWSSSTWSCFVRFGCWHYDHQMIRLGMYHQMIRLELYHQMIQFECWFDQI